METDKNIVTSFFLSYDPKAKISREPSVLSDKYATTITGHINRSPFPKRLNVYGTDTIYKKTVLSIIDEYRLVTVHHELVGQTLECDGDDNYFCALGKKIAAGNEFNLIFCSNSFLKNYIRFLINTKILDRIFYNQNLFDILSKTPLSGFVIKQLPKLRPHIYWILSPERWWNVYSPHDYDYYRPKAEEDDETYWNITDNSDVIPLEPEKVIVMEENGQKGSAEHRYALAYIGTDGDYCE
jgi:hypothetical protein